jgi:hypothetical protein
MLKLFVIPNGGVGSIPHNAFSKMEKVENLVEELRTNKITYVKKLKMT